MKILIAVLTCHRYRMRADSQRQTWVKDVRGADVRFFLGNGEGQQLMDEVWLDVPDDYKGLPAKTRAMCAWADQQGYDFVLKLDDDTYLAAERALNSDFAKHDYTGRLRGPSGDYAAPYASGFAYWLSRKAMKIIAAADLGNHAAEDRLVGNVLHEAGIQCFADYRYAVVTSIRNAKSAPQGPRKGNRVIAACEFSPDRMKEIHYQWLSMTALPTAGLPTGSLSRVCVMIKTFLRDGYLMQCILGLQRNFPEVKMVIVDDGYECHHKIGLYAQLRALGHDCVWMAFDSGFGAKANATIPYCDRDYVLIGSDDFDFADPAVRPGVERMATVLDNLPEVGIASGRCDGKPYEGLLEFYPGGVREMRGYSGEGSVAGVEYKFCDLTVNYCLVRRKVLEQVHWDGGEIKIGGGEHAAFFIDVLKAGWKTVYVPGANVKQMLYRASLQHPNYPNYRARARQPGRPALKSRGIDEYVLFDGGKEIC